MFFITLGSVSLNLGRILAATKLTVNVQARRSDIPHRYSHNSFATAERTTAKKTTAAKKFAAKPTATKKARAEPKKKTVVKKRKVADKPKAPTHRPSYS